MLPMTVLVRTIALKRPFMLRICSAFLSELELSTVIVYLPAGRVLLFAVNANGILAITTCALLCCAPAVYAVARMMIAKVMLMIRFMVNLHIFIGSFALHLFTRRFAPDSLTGPKHLL